jgi:hypothetical protein
VSLFDLLLSTAALIALFHMIAPDHWVPLLIISKARNYTRQTKYIWAFILGLGHSGSSVIVALAVLYVGLEVLKSSIVLLTDVAIILMFAISVYFFVNGLREAGEDTEKLMEKSALAISAFPDLAFLPILVASSTLGLEKSIPITLTFISVTVVTLVCVVWLSSNIPWMDRLKNMPGRYTDYLIAIILAVTGVVLYFGL